MFGASPKVAGNWIINIAGSSLSIERLTGLLALVEKNVISGSIAKTVFDTMMASGRTAEEIVAAEDLAQIDDEGQIARLVAEVVGFKGEIAQSAFTGEFLRALPGGIDVESVFRGGDLRARGRRLRVVSSSTDDDASKVAMAHASTIESAADTADRNEEAVAVRSSLSKLPAEQREVLVLRYLFRKTVAAAPRSSVPAPRTRAA
jgi:hypothetical protein